MFLLSLDEVERVKRINGINTYVKLGERTALSERTWRHAIKTRKPTPQVLDALARLGARPDRILVADEPARIPA